MTKTITEEALLAARSYVPLAEKTAFVEAVAGRCFEKLEIRAKDGGTDAAMPPMYKENMQRKSRYLMGALAKLYFGEAFVPAEGETYLMSLDDYDCWAGGHILNQMERMKQKGAPLREKAFDLLQDYRDLEKRLNTEVYGLCGVMNDPCQRMMAMVQMQATPEAMQKAAAELRQVQRELLQYERERTQKMEARA